MNFRVAIVGSGPSGVTAAGILIAAGINVDMYDVGTDAKYEDQRTNKVVKEGVIPRKALFGKTYMYCRRDGMRIIKSDNVSFDTSHAKGGLSTVWGATVSAVTAHDIADWPVSIQEISEHLKDVFSSMHLSARDDMIDRIYPIKLQGIDLQYENTQSEFILKMAQSNASELIKREIYIGKSKLAINNNVGSENGCILCAKCMTGCERGSIFNSWSIVRSLQKQPFFRYFDDCLVQRFDDSGDFVIINLLNLNDGLNRNERYDSVILAAGCIDSTKIVDSSLGWTGHEYHINDSQKYYFPVWVDKGRGSVVDKSISLAHLYVQSFDSNGNVVQGQLYASKFILSLIFEDILGKLGGIIGNILSPYLNRIYVGVAYFSSSVSGKIGIRFTDDNQMFLRGIVNQKSGDEFNNFISKLLNSRKLTGFAPIFRIKLRSKLGHSQHFGGTIPMRVNPVIYEADNLGRPFGCKNVYIVDSTVLTSVPATPTTSLVMANSARIASSLVEIFKKRL
jgi:ferredoxin